MGATGDPFLCPELSINNKSLVFACPLRKGSRLSMPTEHGEAYGAFKL